MTTASPARNARTPEAAARADHVLITGASSGIGRELALHYATRGVILSLTGRDAARLAETVAECSARGARQVAQALLDITEAEALSHWLLERDAATPVDTLIAAAGIGGADVVPGESGESAALAGRIFGVNTVGAVNTVAPLLPRMVARGRGRVAIIGSIAGRLGLPQAPVYSAAKAALEVYADGLRPLVGPRGVRVTIVLPGFVDTPMSRSLDMPRPWCWSAERAARHIAAAVDRGARRCIFPWPLRAAIALGRLTPAPILDFILARANRIVEPKRGGG